MTIDVATEHPRVVCVTRNASLKRTLQRTLMGAGFSVVFADDLTPSMVRGTAIVVMDQECRRSSDPSLFELMNDDGKIIILGASLEDDEVIVLCRDLPMNHLISEMTDPDESELMVTSVKLHSGDIFGVDKYLAWGVDIRETVIKSYDEKRGALLDVAAHAREVGARRQVIARIERVADELLMNALYDAPAIRNGVSRRHRIHKSTVGEVPSHEAALLRHACDGRYFALSVQDNYGELHKETILDHLRRARAERGQPRPVDPDSPSGAGLGLYFILSSVTRFIANIEPGSRTEVICLFDMKQRGRDASSCARSLHVFNTPAPPPRIPVERADSELPSSPGM